ncbi:MAG: L-threonylcarbamoyladenylate synthase [Candidatus Omnitrophica bacterium]|nr:L-threonylcarbamoyladenylate synthase [Candidatus Omnitrophota bacterium]MCM8800018.1 L-threonylcarbamoyladenylate synthase [Candidatus Omnitrophota bacterium]
MIKTPLLRIDPQHIDEKKIKKVAEILTKGGLVIIPTDTVYGIVANSKDESVIKKLYEIKKRPLDKPFTIIIERKERIDEFSKIVPKTAYKLIDKFWPGALTVIIPKEDGTSVGLRMPNHPFILRLLGELDFPLVCPSANLSEKKPPSNLEEALKDLDGLVDLAVDGGFTSLGVESTIVDLSKETISILREGAISKKEIQEEINKKIVLFVCTGNSCRSVMAEGLLKKKLFKLGRTDIEVISAGIAMVDGLKPTPETLELLNREGIDFSGYVSKRVSPLMIKKSDLIFVMESLHEKRLKELVPDIKNNLFLLKEFAKIEETGSLDIADPIGKPFLEYEKTFYLIKEAIERIVNIL